MDDEKQNGDTDEPGAACPVGDECPTFSRLLTKCCDVSAIASMTQPSQDTQEINHCLEYHADFREQCIFEQSCQFEEVLRTSCNNRFAQLHAHFYHEMAIDAEDDESKVSEQPLVDEEMIHYKSAEVVIEETQCVEMLEFGHPFVISNKADARFANAKQEMLQNEYHSISKQEWNGLLRKCIVFGNSKRAKAARFAVKEIVALKLYTGTSHKLASIMICCDGPDL